MVLASLSRLAALGLIADTGQRVGQTRQVKVWRLACDPESVPVGDCSADVKRSLSTILSEPETVPVGDTKPYY